MLSKLLRLFRRSGLDYDNLTAVIIGLGNTGRRYAATRHNVGFMVVDELAGRAGLQFRPGRGDFHAARWTRDDGDVLLVKPTTFMNNSGVAAEQIRELTNLSVADIFVVVDDINLALGRIRLRGKGSAGGQRGLESLILTLSDEAFPRLRLGIGQPDQPTSGYVLALFPEEDLDTAARMINVAADATTMYLDYGLEKTMSQFNKSL
ncbi:MAG: aminoacyl-tRNA hydrolase [bacterium]|nr:aminoacyl-tRNA hydrolase [bacterium]